MSTVGAAEGRVADESRVAARRRVAGEGRVPAPRSGSAAVRVDEAPPARWPATPGRRWVSRLALSVPLAAAVAYLHAAGLVPAAEVDAPFGPWLLAVQLAAAGAGGAAAHSVVERLVRRRVPTWLVALLVLTTVAAAGVGLDVTTPPAGVVALALLVVALDGALRFASAGDTHGGFVAGLLLAVAFVADPSVLPLVLALGLLSPLVAAHRHRGQPHAATATALVLLFPVVAGLVAWTYLEWQFMAGPTLLPGLVDSLSVAGPGRFGLGVLALTPLFVVVGALLAARGARPLVAYLLAAVATGSAVLLLDAWTPGRGLALLVVLAAMALPASPSPRQQLVLAVGCAAQVAAVVASGL